MGVKRPAIHDLGDGSATVPIKRNHVRPNKAVIRSDDFTGQYAAPRAHLEVDGSGTGSERSNPVVGFERDIFRTVGVGAKRVDQIKPEMANVFYTAARRWRQRVWHGPRKRVR